MNQNISDLSYVIIFFYKFLTDWRKIGVSRRLDLLKTPQNQGFITPMSSSSGRKQPSFQSLLNLLISHNRSKQRFFRNRYIPINSCSFLVDWSTNWCKWCRSFYPRSRNAAYSLDTLLYSLLKYESRPSNSDCLSSFVTSV